MNLDSWRPIALNNCGHALSWWFYLYCGSVETGSPGIICVICQQVLHHPFEHGTSSMGKPLQAKAQIANVNKWTESEGTELPGLTIEETALAILKRAQSRGITIVSSPR
jgi:hypothetical protein